MKTPLLVTLVIVGVPYVVMWMRAASMIRNGPDESDRPSDFARSRTVSSVLPQTSGHAPYRILRDDVSHAAW
jgi:hypothetical protein